MAEDNEEYFEISLEQAQYEYQKYFLADVFEGVASKPLVHEPRLHDPISLKFLVRYRL